MTCSSHFVFPQLLDGLDVLQKNTLSPIKQEFIAQSVTETYRNLTAQDFIRSDHTQILYLCENDCQTRGLFNLSIIFKSLRNNINTLVCC